MDKIKNPTGVVHYASAQRFINHRGMCQNETMCNPRKYFRALEGFTDQWPKTIEPVTCKRCLKMKLLGKLKDAKFHARVIHHDVRQGVELTLDYPKGDLLKTLVSQGYINKIPKKGEQIEITIWGEI